MRYGNAHYAFWVIEFRGSWEMSGWVFFFFGANMVQESGTWLCLACLDRSDCIMNLILAWFFWVLDGGIVTALLPHCYRILKPFTKFTKSANPSMAFTLCIAWIALPFWVEIDWKPVKDEHTLRNLRNEPFLFMSSSDTLSLSLSIQNRFNFGT